MNINNKFDDKTEIIKQIGKGSFSKVYLCKKDLPFLFETLDDYKEYFIVKEININKLVNKYIGSNKKYERVVDKEQNSQMELNITPYTRDKLIITRSSEQEYYYKRLTELIESEIDVLYGLKHKNIVDFYHCKRMAGIYHLHMEYCEYGDVQEYLKNIQKRDSNPWGGITYKILKSFILQVGRALEYIHSSNFIHRDIKLQNILIKQNELSDDLFTFKISDFGFTCYNANKIENSSYNNTDYDDVLVKKYYKLCGTPYYMAPEILLNIKKLENFTEFDKHTSSFYSKKIEQDLFYDNTIDLWSLGICIYELIFNKLPFPKINDIKDLENFYKSDMVQQYINQKISKHKIPLVFQNILGLLLITNSKNRNNLNDILSIILSQEIDKIDIFIDNNNEDDEIDINMLSNITQNDYLTQHIINNPVNNQTKLDDNEKTNEPNESSLLSKMSIDKGFMKWLFKK